MTKAPPTKTGSFRRTNPVTAPTYSKEEIEFKERANPDCGKCHGTGRRGIFVAAHGMPCSPSPIPCKCVTKAIEAEAIAADLKYRAEHPEESTGYTGMRGPTDSQIKTGLEPLDTARAVDDLPAEGLCVIQSAADPFK